MNPDSRKRVFERICSEHNPQEICTVLHTVLCDDPSLSLAARRYFLSISDVLASTLCKPIASASEPAMTAGGVLKRGRKKSVVPTLRAWHPAAASGYAVSAVCASSRSTQNRAPKLACRTVAIGNLVEIKSPENFTDNYYGVAFKVYSPSALPRPLETLLK